MTFLQKIPPLAYFWIFIISLAVWYNYPSILFKKPQSVHHWRQADCASLALMYYQNGMNFFEPQVDNLTSDNDTTGFVAPSELPIFYYFMAFLYKVFGYHDYIFRICNTLIFFLGLFYLFRLFRLITQNNFWGIAIACLFFTSPVLVYYGNNFLSNSSAISFSIIGSFYFVRYYNQKKEKYFYLSILFFCLACSMKISAGFVFFVVIFFFLAEKFRIPILREKIFPPGILPWLVILISLALPFSWILYAHHYNLIHSSIHFSTGTYPIWDMEAADINHVVLNVWNLWRQEYFSTSVQLLFLGFGALQLAFTFRNKRILTLTFFLLLIEAMVYILLQFLTFADHDYYTIDLYIILIFWVFNSFIILKQFRKNIFHNKIIKSIFILFLLLNAWHCHQKMKARYEGWWNEYPAYQGFHYIKPYLRSLGIPPLDTIITIPEYSHSLLYLTNQRGWSTYADQNKPHTDRSLFQKDSATAVKWVNHGAKYLLVLDTANTFKYLPAFRYIAKQPIGDFQHIVIFSTKKDYILKKHPKQKIKSIIFMNADSPNPKITQGYPDEFILKNEGLRSPEKQFSGKYSIKTDPNHPYGFTTIIKNVQPGEEFELNVWCTDKNGLIVASSTKLNNFYLTSEGSQTTSQRGWKLINLKFNAPCYLPGKELKIYTWNKTQFPVFFDDFRMIRKDGYFLKDIL